MHSDKCLKMICIKIQDPKTVQYFVIASFKQTVSGFSFEAGTQHNVRLL